MWGEEAGAGMAGQPGVMEPLQSHTHSQKLSPEAGEEPRSPVRKQVVSPGGEYGWGPRGKDRAAVGPESSGGAIDLEDVGQVGQRVKAVAQAGLCSLGGRTVRPVCRLLTLRPPS